MHAFLLQDWVTIRGQSPSMSPVTQSEAGWLDLDAYDDVVAWIDVKEQSATGGGTLSILLQTAAEAEDDEFLTMLTQAASSLGVTVTPVLKATASVPLLRCVRWQLSVSGLGSPWDVTFRVWVTANAGHPQ
jgi:hypothetical protein